MAGGQHSIQLAYSLLSAENDPEIAAILDNVILVLYPSLNPDGQNMIANWYMKNVGTPYEVSPLPWLYQEYVGHDNNRDGYMQNMLESQEITRAEMDYNPVIFYCQHQTAPFPARIWIPPFSPPISANINPLMLRWLNVIGTNMAAYLDAHQLPGSVHEGGFDNWYPGFMDFTHVFRNEISFFTETALYRYATPHFYSVADFPKGAGDLRTDVHYGSAWPGGWWRLSDAVQYMVGGSMSVLDTAARYREILLYNRYQAGRDNIERFRKEPPFAYVIPNQQRDVPEAGLLVQKMIDNGLEVHQAGQKFTANGMDYPAGSWVILMDQPYAPLAKELFERQAYPQGADGKALDHRPYDVTGWTLPLQMGVEVAAVRSPVSSEQRKGLEKIAKVALPSGAVQGAGSSFLLTGRENNTYRALNRVFTAGGTVGWDAGSGFVVSGMERGKVDSLAKSLSLAIAASAAAPASIPVRKPRVALYRPFAANIDEGWTRWILKDYDFASVTLNNADIQAGHLKERFSVLILPDMPLKQMMDGLEPGTVPGEYAGGLGEAGISAIREFVQDGGSLVALNQAADATIEALKLPVRNMLKGVKPDQFACAGALLKIKLEDANRPMGAGMPREASVMFERGPAFEPLAGFRGFVIASYPKDMNPLQSGYALHAEVLQGKAAALETSYGKGRIFLYGFKPQWRGQSHGTYKLLFSALYDYQNLPAYPEALKVSPPPPAWQVVPAVPAVPGAAAPAPAAAPGAAPSIEESRRRTATPPGR